MAETTDDTMENRATGPTYKSLFLAACAIIGSAFGWWFTNFITYIDTISSRVATLEVRDTENKWTFRINTEKLNTHEDRLRALEREFDVNKGHRREP